MVNDHLVTGLKSCRRGGGEVMGMQTEGSCVMMDVTSGKAAGYGGWWEGSWGIEQLCIPITFMVHVSLSFCVHGGTCFCCNLNKKFTKKKHRLVN